MTPARPQVGIVVVTHNSAAGMPRLLDSLPAALAGVPATVVVVDNGSSDDTVTTCRARGDCVVLEEANLGYAAGINAGTQSLPSGVPVLVLNPDLWLAPGAVPALLQRLAEPGVGIVAPCIVNGAGELTYSLRREPTLLRALGLGASGVPALAEDIREQSVYTRPQEVAWATGAALLVDRACHDELGGWDPSYFLYSEETDFSLRARDHGWSTVYEPRALAHHDGSGSGWNSRLYTMQIINRVRLYARRHRRPAAWAYYGLAVMRELRHALSADPGARAALRALLRPSQRPRELALPPGLLPR